MADVKGNKDKQPPGCDESRMGCPNMKASNETMSSESYACPVCGASYTLYYEDMA